jgi:thiol-disulfide isomerase/thioredoxin
LSIFPYQSEETFLMHRRTFLTLLPAGLVLPALTTRALAADRLFYTPGNAEAAMDAGKIVILDFWTNWCSTCAAQDRVLTGLRAANPAYDKAITFITVDWDKYADSKLSTDLQIPGRSVLVALKGRAEIGRVVADTSETAIKALLDAALAAAA